MIYRLYRKQGHEWIGDYGAPSMADIFKMLPQEYQTDEYVLVPYKPR